MCVKCVSQDAQQASDTKKLLIQIEGRSTKSEFENCNQEEACCCVVHKKFSEAVLLQRAFQ